MRPSTERCLILFLHEDCVLRVTSRGPHWEWNPWHRGQRRVVNHFAPDKLMHLNPFAPPKQGYWNSNFPTEKVNSCFEQLMWTITCKMKSRNYFPMLELHKYEHSYLHTAASLHLSSWSLGYSGDTQDHEVEHPLSSLKHAGNQESKIALS